MRPIDGDNAVQRIREFAECKPRCAEEFYEGQGCKACAWGKIIEIVENTPTIEAEPVVHGEWIMRGGKRYCSACQQRACVTRDMDDFWYTVGTPFCPNCGAKVDGGSDE